MTVRTALILAAGFGSRMGVIGEHLPKPLWPVFDKTLLELQVDFALSLGIEKVYINLHHHAQRIASFIQDKKMPKVELIEEKPEILDVGGAIHNLAKRVNYEGELLVLNSDQFLGLKSSDLILKNSVKLFSIKVNSDDGYNSLVVNDEDLLMKVVPNHQLNRGQPMMTYSGNCLINLSKLPKVTGRSRFFESVANRNWFDVQVQDTSTRYYWDFGTLRRYSVSLEKAIEVICSGKSDGFIDFLVSADALHQRKVNVAQKSYNCSAFKTLNFDKAYHDSLPRESIIIKGEGKKLKKLSSQEKKIIYQEYLADL